MSFLAVEDGQQLSDSAGDRVCLIGGWGARPTYSPDPGTPIYQNFLGFPGISRDFQGFRDIELDLSFEEARY